MHFLFFLPQAVPRHQNTCHARSQNHCCTDSEFLIFILFLLICGPFRFLFLQKCFFQFFYRSITVMTIQCHSSEQCLFLFRCDLCPIHRWWIQGILFFAEQRVFRNRSCDHLIKHRTETVNIRPCFLFPMCLILFRWSIPAFKENRLCPVILCNFPCRTKIYNTETAIFPKHQVIRCQVSVQDMFLMHLFQSIHNRKEQIPRFFKRQRFILAFQIISQTCHPQVFHHNIRISLFLKII